MFCTFLCRCFVRLQLETSRNFPVARFEEEITVACVLVHFFSLLLIFTFVATSISHFLTAAKKIFMLFFQQRMSFLSLALAVCRPFSRWASLTCRLLSLFLCLSLSLYYKFVNMTIILSLLLWTTPIQKRFQLSVFVFIELSLLHKTRVAKWFFAKIILSYIWICHLPYLLIEFFMPVVLMDGRSGLRSRDYQNFSDM